MSVDAKKILGDVGGCVSDHCPPTMFRPPPWRLDDFELVECMYKSENSRLHRAVDKQSGLVVALKTYRKKYLTRMNL